MWHDEKQHTNNRRKRGERSHCKVWLPGNEATVHVQQPEVRQRLRHMPQHQLRHARRQRLPLCQTAGFSSFRPSRLWDSSGGLDDCHPASTIRIPGAVPREQRHADASTSSTLDEHLVRPVQGASRAKLLQQWRRSPTSAHEPSLPPFRPRTQQRKVERPCVHAARPRSRVLSSSYKNRATSLPATARVFTLPGEA